MSVGAPDLVLVVDDEEHDQLIAAHRLRRHWPGVEILQARDGEQAIALLDQCGERLPNLVLLDINMPRMDGHGFLETWCRERGREVPIVVMLTSSDQTVDRARAGIFPNVRDYLVKPLATAHLARLDAVHRGEAGDAAA